MSKDTGVSKTLDPHPDERVSVSFSTGHLQHIAARLFDTPLAIDSRKLETIISVLGPRLGLSTAPATLADQFDLTQPREQDTPSITDAGVAIVPIIGTLVHRSIAAKPMSGLTSYGEIERLIGAALSNPSARAIALVIDSPGGETNQLFDLADMIYAARGGKPIWAVVDEQAASAACVLASAADRIVMPRTAVVGSLGVLAMHVDQSARDKNEGLKFTFISSGARKTDTDPHTPLSDDARARIQAEVDRQAALLFEQVGRNRGLQPAAIQAMEAGLFFGESAVEAGLADEIVSVNEAMEAIESRTRGRITATSSPLALSAEVFDHSFDNFFTITGGHAIDHGRKGPVNRKPSDSVFALVREDRSMHPAHNSARRIANTTRDAVEARARRAAEREINANVVHVVGRLMGTDRDGTEKFKVQIGFRWRPDRAAATWLGPEKVSLFKKGFTI